MKREYKVIHWLPRVIGIAAILFISIFALDAFDPELTIWQQIGGFLIHLIPSFILLGLLLIAWKWEFIGGIIFTVIGVGFSPIIFMHNYRMNESIWLSLSVIMCITVPFIIVGLLFILNHKLKKKLIQ